MSLTCPKCGARFTLEDTTLSCDDAGKCQETANPSDPVCSNIKAAVKALIMARSL